MPDARPAGDGPPDQGWRAFALRQFYVLGWRVGARVPEPAVRRLIELATRRTLRGEGWHVRNLRRNLGVVTGAPPADELMRRALASHFRNVYEQLSLPGWSPERITGRVSTIGESGLREAYAEAGAVVALPHSGNWDWAGAWACRSGLPVTAVAERLGDAEYAAFSSFRRKLGMEVMSHRDPDVVPALVRAVGRRRVIALLADRDLQGSGLEVDWAGHRVRMPAGPALVARRSQAALLPAVSQFTPAGMVLRIGPVIETVRGAGGLQQMTQRVADFFAARIAEQPQDWHMLQPFFPDATS